ncbi:MAG: radical SAM protein [Planctomycetes bacterium]|jgi:wyosine [tRNA(Phe)-imidazoG37] synthetase (radical SAM superfamily)|nr:radical SAM protein [Phycisphaerae bacterium]NBB94623.1 radical SAM protein [Planctomycetota bacterium]
MPLRPDPNPDRVVDNHRRQWRDCRFVYPVVSRRAGGLSIGVNLNIDKRCNYRCIYCQIDRRVGRRSVEIDVDRLGEELDLALQAARSGEVWSEPRFADTPEPMRRINDIAFSGDGEPTCLPQFPDAVDAAVDALKRADADDVKIVLITNSTHLRDATTQDGLKLLDAHNGEIWAKLDAGTEEMFRRVNRPPAGLTLQEICDNLLATALVRPIVIQTLLMRIDGEPPVDAEIAAYIGRLRWLIGNGGQVKLLQLHTVARPPAMPGVAMLPEPDLRAIAAHIGSDLPGLDIAVYTGREVSPQRAAPPDAAT